MWQIPFLLVRNNMYEKTLKSAFREDGAFWAYIGTRFILPFKERRSNI